ncbi:MAG TPA: amidohydrolase family protein [Anaerolineaceae bacterium]|nr:amidohydrolase family protein [Anaerolineaceae bacterium]
MIAIKSKWLIQSAQRVLKQHGLLLEDNKIIDVLPNSMLDELVKSGTVELIDATDKILCPGFVNTHMHQYGVLSHGMLPRIPIMSFKAFLEDYWWPGLENKLRCPDVVLTAKISALELVSSGVTTLCDILEAPFTEEGTLIEQGKVLEQLGMRGIVSLESSERVNIENGERCLQENLAAIRYFKGHSTLIKGAMCTHTTFTCSSEFIRKAAALARAEAALYQFHLSESKHEPEFAKKRYSKPPVEIYLDSDALSAQTLASQCVKLSGEEISLLAKSQCKFSHMPLSNCEVGGGIAPIPEMISAGMVGGLGTDGYINDFFEVMRAAFLIHKANAEDASVMPGREVFRLATESGASCLGWSNVGKLEKGYEADFVVINNQFSTPLTSENIFDQLIVFGKKEYVKQVFVAGNLIYDCTREFYGGIEADKARLQERCKDLWGN